MDTTLIDPLVGRVLDGRYRVEARIARGGMATVYRAVDTRLERVVAVKVMHPSLAGDPDFVARFNREAKAAARLTNPGVVGVYDQGVDQTGPEPTVFLVMEYVAGHTLRDVLHQGGPIPPPRALELLEPVLAALGAAHAAGLVHRDVKPENVLIGDDGRIKVADFGLVRAVEATSRVTTVGLLIGTVAYLSPEHVRVGAADARSDVYAAGVMLYEMLTGAPPFTGESAMAVAYQHVHEDVPPPSAQLPGLPEPVDDLVARATARDPQRRFADGYEFLGAVRQARAALPPAPAEAPTARVPGPPQQPTLIVSPGGPTAPAGSARQPKRRSLAGRIAVLLVALLVVAAALGGWWLAVGRYRAVPSVLNLSQAEAQQRLGAQGMRWRWLPPRFDPTVPADRVALEQPGPGGRLPRGGVVTLALSKGPEVHQVPDLAGTPVASAQQQLAAISVRTATTESYSDAVSIGLVISTSPAAGATVHPGDLVTLTVSRGPQPVPVPDGTGKPADEVAAALAKAGFKVTNTKAFSDTVNNGLVISQNPSKGNAPHGSTVALVVSKGPQLFPVPDVGGMSVREARQVLSAAGFQLRVFAPFGWGSVRAQSPAPGTMAPRGRTVSVIAY